MITENTIKELETRLSQIEDRFGAFDYDTRGVVQSEMRNSLRVHSQAETQFGVYIGLCVETIDIWKENRIRFFCPLYHDPKRPIKELPWAYPISAMGGFDDSGLSWVPPAGASVAILFACGARGAPYYIGTTWHRDRGPTGQHNWGVNIDEYYKVSEGHRSGYLAGPNDESQVLPPWNTEQYNGFDISSAVDFSNDPEAQKRITTPHIYGFKTPEKHAIKMVDGDPKCNRRWKRFELTSSNGNYIMMKDDHLHYAGQWAHPSCGGQEGDVSCIEGQNNGTEGNDITRIPGLSNNVVTSPSTDDTPKEGEKKEQIGCEDKKSNKKIIGGHPRTPPGTKYAGSQVGANPYFKHENECRPFKGPRTPENNVCDLPQSGIQICSISGHTLVMDDSVEEPSGDMGWERSKEGFSFGCNDHFLGRSYWKSATGHMIEMSDIESPAGDDGRKLRGDQNFIRLLSANGNRIELNDHTVEQKDCPGCPPNVGGKKRGITMETTSKHTFEMIDEQNEQCSECRKSGGQPVPKAKKAFIRIRTGYGLEFLMKDDNSQEKTVNQQIKLFCPQKDNSERGPHINLFQESVEGPGLVFLRVGGDYVVSTYDNYVIQVGDQEKHPTDMMEIVSGKKIVYTKDAYLNISKKSHLFLASEKILLMAGEDCTDKEKKKGPCIGPVLVYVNGCLRLSDRVYATASCSASPASIFMLSPLVDCPADCESEE